MPVQDILAVAAGVCGVGMAVAPTIQMIRMIRLGDATAVSVPYLLVISLGASIWLAYGISITNWSLIIANSTSTIVSLACATVAYRMHRRSERAK